MSEYRFTGEVVPAAPDQELVTVVRDGDGRPRIARDTIQAWGVFTSLNGGDPDLEPLLRPMTAGEDGDLRYWPEFWTNAAVVGVCRRGVEPSSVALTRAMKRLEALAGPFATDEAET